MRGLVSMRAMSALMMAPASESATIMVPARGVTTTRLTEEDEYKRLRARTPRRMGQTEEQYEWNLRVDAKKRFRQSAYYRDGMTFDSLTFNDAGGPMTEVEGDLFINGKFIGKASNLKITPK